jgi:hypothetical protein
MTPFGALDVAQPKAANLEESVALEKFVPSLHFTPEHQVLHGPSTFSLTIEDPEGVAENVKLMVNYNGLDVTKEFLRHAQLTALDPGRRTVRITTKHLRLPPGRENAVRIAYWSTAGGKPVVAQYQPPTCSAFLSKQAVYTVPEFDPPLSLLQTINMQSERKNLNPYFVTALIAQESGFDPSAISRDKALGLTQITSLGEREIIKNFNDWPRYPALDEMSLPVLKLAVMSGIIHSGNEWRLDPTRSIEGGVEYLSYLADYWKRPEKRAEVERRLGPSETAVSEIMLASYNSGPTRVGDALERYGDKWLQDKRLGQARKYVRRVVSFCDHFENGEE